MLKESDDCKGNKISLITGFKDLVGKVGDNRALLQSLKDSPFFHRFADKALLWEVKLSDLEY